MNEYSEHIVFINDKSGRREYAQVLVRFKDCKRFYNKYEIDEWDCKYLGPKAIRKDEEEWN